MPINISGPGQMNAALGGAGGSVGTSANVNGQDDDSQNILGLFASLLNMAEGVISGDQDGTTPGLNAKTEHTGQNWLNLQLGDFSATLDSTNPEDALSKLSELLGLDMDVKADADLDPNAAMTGLIGQLSDLLNSLAGKLDNAITPNADLTQQATAAQRLARALVQQIGGADGSLTGEVDATLNPGSAGNASSAGESQSNNSALPAQLRALAADLDLVRHGINIPAARADANAVFKGNAPTLEQLLQPAQGQGQGAQSGTDPQGAETRLADTLGAALAAKAGAQANQPAAGNAATGLAALLASQQGAASADAGADAVLNTQITPSGAPTISADTSAAARPMQAAYQAPQLNLPNIAFEMSRQFNAGNNRFQIRLDPPELGRIDVRMNVDAHGAVHARLAVDRPETLDMLQRDARALERALGQAGIDSSKTSLEFSLRQNPFAGQNSGDGSDTPWQGGNSANLDTEQSAETSDLAAAQVTHTYRGFAAPGGVNLWV